MTDAAETMDVDALLAWLVMVAAAVAIISLVTPKGAYGRRQPAARPRRQPASEPRPSTPALAWPQAAAGRQPGQISDEYWLYIRDRIPGKDGHTTWRQRTKPWKDEFRHYRRPCEIGRALKQLGYPNCGPRPIPPGQPIHADHTDDGYRHLFAEERTDVALGCESCHAIRERLKRQGVYIYRELAARTNGGNHAQA